MGKGEVAHMNVGRWVETNGAKLFQDKWRGVAAVSYKVLGRIRRARGLRVNYWKSRLNTKD
jgi:hypothetical protein